MLQHPIWENIALSHGIFKKQWLDVNIDYIVICFISECNCDCIGFKSDCVNENCTCPKNYSFHGNGRDCQQGKILEYFCFVYINNFFKQHCEKVILEGENVMKQKCPWEILMYTVKHNGML
jgi:hypothetical protein